MKKILIIDDDTYICNLLENFLNNNGFQAHVAYNHKSAIQKIGKTKYDLVLCDFRLPDGDGMEILSYLKKQHPETQAIIMTAYADIRMAVKLIKNGALDYITKPIYPEEILVTIKKVLSAERQKENANSFELSFIKGQSQNMQQVLEYVEKVAPTEMTVLIQGETGSGKEYIARAIHYNSARKNKPFVAVDCGAIPKELANSELFGHVKGAFTGALYDKKGYFETANGGTLFLDEIGNLTIENQIKMLRAIQERVINKVGDKKNINVDLRILVATNEDLYNEVKSNNFREDLYHRVNEFKINIPPLRERKEDIPVFADNFIKSANKSLHKEITGMSEEVLDFFLRYPWYGNIRELQNVVKRSVLLAQTDKITIDCIPEEIKYHRESDRATPHSSSFKSVSLELKEASLEAEREVISNALVKTNYNKTKAAKLLNIDRKTLYNKIKQFEIELDDVNNH